MSHFARVLELFWWFIVCFSFSLCLRITSCFNFYFIFFLTGRFAYSKVVIPLLGEKVSRNSATRVQPPPATSHQLI